MNPNDSLPADQAAPAAYTADERLPLALGRLHGELSWFNDHSGDPTQDIAECRIRCTCPCCGRETTHGWRLDGRRRVEERLSHCCGTMIRIRPALARVKHEWAPLGKVARPTRFKRRERSSESKGVLTWFRGRAQ
jgi:hypothetical protein